MLTDNRRMSLRLVGLVNIFLGDRVFGFRRYREGCHTGIGGVIDRVRGGLDKPDPERSVSVNFIIDIRIKDIAVEILLVEIDRVNNGCRRVRPRER